MITIAITITSIQKNTIAITITITEKIDDYNHDYDCNRNRPHACL